MKTFKTIWPLNISKKHSILIFLLSLICSFLQAQHNQVNYPLNRWSSIRLDQYLSESDSIPHSAVKPYIIQKERLYDLPGFKADTGVYYFNVTKKLFGDNVIVVDKEDLFVTIDPILHIEVGAELRDPSSYADTAQYFINTRGFNFRGSIGEKLSFETFFSENQIFVPLYQRQRILDTRVAPGATIVKTFQTNGFDFGYAGGFVSYQAFPNWNVQMGHGKHFIGEGHRSIILSDNSSPYPYFRSTLNLVKGKIELTNIYSIFQNLTRLPPGDSPESLYQRKAMSLNAISVSPIKELKFSIYEGVIWQTFIPGEGDLSFSPNWIVPLPFFNLGTLDWDERNNLFIALDAVAKPHSKVTLFGQFLLDDPGSNRQSWQYGVKITEPFEGFNLRAEYNQANHFTGAHQLPLQALTHNNLPLAHPLGAGFQEYIGQVSYKWQRWFCDISYQNARTDTDIELSPQGSTNVGIDLLQEYTNVTAEPSSIWLTQLNSTSIRMGYQFNSFYNLMMYIGYQQRNYSPALANNERNGLISFGIKTELFNHYYDF